MLMSWFPEFNPNVSSCLFQLVMVVVDDCMSVAFDVGCCVLWGGDSVICRGVSWDYDGDKETLSCPLVMHCSSCWYVNCVI